MVQKKEKDNKKNNGKAKKITSFPPAPHPNHMSEEKKKELKLKASKVKTSDKNNVKPEKSQDTAVLRFFSMFQPKNKVNEIKNEVKTEAPVVKIEKEKEQKKVEVKTAQPVKEEKKVEVKSAEQPLAQKKEKIKEVFQVKKTEEPKTNDGKDAQERPVIKYKSVSAVGLKKAVELYNSGKVRAHEYDDSGKLTAVNEFIVPVEEINYYVKQLLDMGFFNFQEYYVKDAHDKDLESLALVQGTKEKEIFWSKGKPPSFEFVYLISRLSKLKFSVKQGKEEKKIIRKWVLGAALFVILLSIISLLASGALVSETKETVEKYNVAEQVWLTVPRQINNSFEIYLNAGNITISEDVVVVGFLKQEVKYRTETSSYIDYYVVDDYGRQIKLSFALLKNSAQYTTLFPNNTVSSDLYKVAGSLQKDMFSEPKVLVYTVERTGRLYEDEKVLQDATLEKERVVSEKLPLSASKIWRALTFRWSEK